MRFKRTTCELVAVTYGKAAAGATSGALYANGAATDATGTSPGLALAQAMAISTTIAI